MIRLWRGCKNSHITIQKKRQQSSERELVTDIVNVPNFLPTLYILKALYIERGLNVGDSSRDDEVSLFFKTIK